MNKWGRTIYLKTVIDIHGKGCATGKLIEITERIVKEAKIIYQNIWVVFDKDDFEDFDQAIKDGVDRGYKIAWSNQSFEYWHFIEMFGMKSWIVFLSGREGKRLLGKPPLV